MSCDPEPVPIRSVAVLGAGTMGHGIAQVCASAGLDTRLFDIDGDALSRARGQISANLDRGVELGKVEPVQRDSTLDRLMLETDLEAAVGDTQIVVEAAPERLELKRELLGRAATGVTADCLLASNTSSLSITAIAEPLPGPERVIGIHFFNPVHIMALVEVVRGDRTAERAVEQARAFAVRLGKQPIVVRDSPGFASSRLG
ncbi:MAG: 3-hydroxyacyl-CoA dehydrogenase family protein, partial [Gemmatimonadetes bacterium]|nr:3-hydroxyacyl-CoA dehydrogenase family protein [Gemmatimonadota bacterium]